MYLLDTHTILWFLHNSPQLSKKALNIITKDSIIPKYCGETVW